jgi:Ca-activated chloride channel family protein
MKVGLEILWSDAHLDGKQINHQRQLCLGISAIEDQTGTENMPLNLCLVLDHSGSMQGTPLETVKQAALSLVQQLRPLDRISVIAFDHQAKVIVPNQLATDLASINRKIQSLRADGGTSIDEGLKLGMAEIAKGKQATVSQIFLLTDGENEHGDNQRCLKLAGLAPEYKISLQALGFGDKWNQDILEKIADAGAGSLRYIEYPEQAVQEFATLFNRLQSVGLTNASLLLTLSPQARLAELKPIAQVAPDTIELSPQLEGASYRVYLGDLMQGQERLILANLYLSNLPPGPQTIGQVQISYDHPGYGENLLSPVFPLILTSQSTYQAAPSPKAQQAILALGKYRQTQMAEIKLQQGDRTAAATLLQSAANTALQMGDTKAATVLQNNATRLQTGEELSDSDRKKTRIAAKTTLQ